MDISTLKELSIGVASLLIIGSVVVYLTRLFLKYLKEQRDVSAKELQETRDDFCKLMSNHIEHNTSAIQKLDEAIQKNTEVLTKISAKIKK